MVLVTYFMFIYIYIYKYTDILYDKKICSLTIIIMAYQKKYDIRNNDFFIKIPGILNKKKQHQNVCWLIS